MTTHYLEFSSTTEHSHKFYEITVNGQTVTTRFGRIGSEGTTQVKTYFTVEIARQEAEKKYLEKQRKGYQSISQPLTNTSAIADSSVNSASTPPLDSPEIAESSDLETHVAPIIWRFNSGFSSFALAIEKEYCWLGNERGRVLKLDQQGQILEQYQLPRAVKSIVTDDIWVYVGCDNGTVYDMTGKIPYVAYQIESTLDIYCLDIYDGILGVSDINGGLTKIDPEGEILWSRLSPGKQGWMLRCDAQGFYHGHSKGLTMYDWEQGRQLWHQPTIGKVLFGCQQGNYLYAATSGKWVQSFSKDGNLIQSYRCDASVYSCATDYTGEFIFAGDSSGFIYGFNQSGKRLWKLSTGCGSALSMVFSGDDGNRLYLATNQGILACMALGQSALSRAKKGDVPKSLAVENTLSTTSSPPIHLDQAKPNQLGIVLECFRQGNHLRVRAISEDYHSDWMVQFPRNLRKEGDRYIVQELRASQQGDFYRVHGEIKRLV
jgi:predicted DNA-binding WGR domain protein